MILWLLGVFSTWRLTHPNRRTYAYMLSAACRAIRASFRRARAFTQWTLTSRRGAPVWEITGDDPKGPAIILTHGWGNSRYDALLRLGPFLRSRIIAGISLVTATRRHVRPGVGRQDLAALVEQVDADASCSSAGRSAGVSVAAAAARIVAVARRPLYRPTHRPRACSRRRRARRATLWPAMVLIGLIRKRKLTWAGVGRFDRAAYAGKLAAPLLVIHGEEDRVCPLEDGRDIAEAAPNGRLVVLPARRTTGCGRIQRRKPL